jgi:hypothetical protein
MAFSHGEKADELTAPDGLAHHDGAARFEARAASIPTAFEIDLTSDLPGRGCIE